MMVKYIFSGNRIFHIDLIAGVVFTLLLHGSKEDRVIFLFRTQFIIPLLNKQNRGLGSCVRFEHISMQAYNGKDAAALSNKFTDVLIAGVVKAALRQDDSHTTAGFKEVQVTLDKQYITANLSKSFSRAGKNEFFAVDHVSFDVMPGEILGIVGESGSGKSTIARLITRQIDATTGTIEIDGQDITRLVGRHLIPVYAKIQMVFQTPAGSFDPRRTLGDGICESLRKCGLPPEFLERYPHQVSGGQCQRAAIARALMCDPRILIFDEATSSLDVTVQKQIIELLQQLQKEKGLAYLFICHNLALVQQFCDRVIVLYDGKIVEHGLPDEVILQPQSDYARRLVDAIF